jgi:hypothetical protein
MIQPTMGMVTGPVGGLMLLGWLIWSTAESRSDLIG